MFLHYIFFNITGKQTCALRGRFFSPTIFELEYKININTKFVYFIVFVRLCYVSFYAEIFGISNKKLLDFNEDFKDI